MADFWTISALSTKDGIGESALNATFATTWTFPTGQMGNYTGYHYKLSANNPSATWVTKEAVYTLSRQGEVVASWLYNGITVGSGAAGNMQLWFPLVVSATATQKGFHIMDVTTGAAVETATTFIVGASGTCATLGSALLTAVAENGIDDNASNNFATRLSYKAF